MNMDLDFPIVCMAPLQVCHCAGEVGNHRPGLREDGCKSIRDQVK